MNRNDNGLEKQFQGSVYANLENAYTTYYRVDGEIFTMLEQQLCHQVERLELVEQALHIVCHLPQVSIK